MLLRSVPFAAILPIEERGINLRLVERYQQEFERGREFQPTPLVPLYPDILDRDLIAVDAHHRTYTLYRMGRLVVPGIIYTEDKDIEASTAPALVRMGTLDAVRQVYQDRWRINMAGISVVSFTELPVYESPPLDSWQPALVSEVEQT